MFKKGLAALLFVLQPLAFPQSASLNTPSAHPSLKDFGIEYPLSSDWVKATQLVRTRVESEGANDSFDVLLAAVYVPKDDISQINPSFSLVAFRQPATDCKKNLESMIAQAQNNEKKSKFEGGVEQFSSAGRDYFQVKMAHGLGGRHGSMICTTARGHLLVWNAGAPNEKGMAKIIDTLGLIAALPAPETSKTVPSTVAHSTESKEEGPDLQDPISVPPKIKVSAAMTRGLLIKRVNPSYPPLAREARIQGTIVLQAEISKEGDIATLELISGPIELAGSAVSAVRKWKYKPYELNGQPVAVLTQITVNYELRY